MSVPLGHYALLNSIRSEITIETNFGCFSFSFWYAGAFLMRERGDKDSTVLSRLSGRMLPRLPCWSRTGSYMFETELTVFAQRPNHCGMPFLPVINENVRSYCGGKTGAHIGARAWKLFVTVLRHQSRASQDSESLMRLIRKLGFPARMIYQCWRGRRGSYSRLEMERLKMRAMHMMRQARSTTVNMKVLLRGAHPRDSGVGRKIRAPLSRVLEH